MGVAQPVLAFKLVPAMLWLVLLFIIWGVLHSGLASLRVKELVRGWIGDGKMRFYRLFYNVFAGVSFLPVVVLVVLAPNHTIFLVPLPWSILMVAGQGLAFIALVIGLKQTDPWEFLGLRQLTAVDKNVTGLFTGGLYRHVRHPLYTAGLAFIWLMPLMTVTTLVLNVCLTIYILVGALLEERKLRQLYGQAYVDYSARTPMLIPFTRWNKRLRKSSL